MRVIWIATGVVAAASITALLWQRASAAEKPLSRTGLEDSRDEHVGRGDVDPARLQRQPTNRTSLTEVETEAGAAAGPPGAIQIEVWLRATRGKAPLAGVPGVEVHAMAEGADEARGRLGKTDSEGRLTAELAAAGRYVFELNNDSIPDSLSRAGSSNTSGPNFPGVSRSGYSVDVFDGSTVELWLQESRFLRGHVVDADGAYLGGVEVQISAAIPGLESVSESTVTDDRGYFELNGLYPILYSLRLTGWGSALEKSRVPIPPPQIVSLEERSVDDAWIALRPGPYSVSGRVLDEAGSPFPGLSVLAYYSTPAPEDSDGQVPTYRYTMADCAMVTRTDSKGRFRFLGLLDHPMRVQIAPNAAGSGSHSPRLITRGPDVIEMDFSTITGRHLVLEDVSLTRSHTFEVTGSLELTAERYEGQRLRTGSMVIEASFAQPREPDSSAWGTQLIPYVDYDRKSGRFTVSCDTPNGEIVLKVFPYGREELARKYRYLPFPDGSMTEQVLTYP